MNPLRAPRTGAAPGFEEFVAERAAPMLGLAHVLVRHPQQAEDLVQEVLAAVLAKWSRVSTAGDPVAYANRMLVNAATSWRRRPSRRESPAPLDENQPAPDALGPSNARLALVTALRTLSARQRAVLALRYLEDWPDEDVAHATGLTLSGVRSCAQRGLTALRASGALDGYGATGQIGTAEPGPPRAATLSRGRSPHQARDPVPAGHNTQVPTTAPPTPRPASSPSPGAG